MEATLLTADVFSLADRLTELKDRKAALEEQTKAVNAEIEEVERELAEAMLNEELQSFNRGGRMFYLRTETFVSVIPEQKENLCRWLKQNGHGSLVYETVNNNSLRALVRELNEDGRLTEELTSMVRVLERPAVGIRKSR